MPAYLVCVFSLGLASQWRDGDDEGRGCEVEVFDDVLRLEGVAGAEEVVVEEHEGREEANHCHSKCRQTEAQHSSADEGDSDERFECGYEHHGECAVEDAGGECF